MEKDEKKPTFEPVSAEEAKKIRATGSKDGSWDSGVLCESGVSDPQQACIGKGIGSSCCYLLNGSEQRGKCVEFGHFPPDSLLSMRCIVEP